MVDDQGRRWQARARGKFKIDASIRSSNPIAVGDWVELLIESEEQLTAVMKLLVEISLDIHCY